MSNTQELPQVTEAIIVDDADRYMNLVHENESMLKQLQANQVSMQMMLEELVDRRKENEAYRKEVDRLNNEALQKSLAIQAVREHIKKQKETIDILVHHCRKLCDEVEARYDNDENFPSTVFISPEFARDYMDAALFLENHFGRKGNRVEQAKKWYDNQ